MSENSSEMPDALNQATQMVKTGRLEEAQGILVRYLAQNPASEQAWLLMSYVVTNAQQQKDCLERVLRINPGNLVARSKLAQIDKAAAGTASQGTQPPAPTPLQNLPSESQQLQPEKPMRVEASPAVPIKQSAKMPAASPPKPSGIVNPPAKEITNPISPVIPPIIEPKNVASKTPKKGGRFDLPFRILIIILLVLIAGMILTIIYFGVISPFVARPVSTPTAEPIEVFAPTFPPTWTPSQTPTVTATSTITLTPTLTPTETLESTDTKTPKK